MNKYIIIFIIILIIVILAGITVFIFKDKFIKNTNEVIHKLRVNQSVTVNGLIIELKNVQQATTPERQSTSVSLFIGPPGKEAKETGITIYSDAGEKEYLDSHVINTYNNKITITNIYPYEPDQYIEFKINFLGNLSKQQIINEYCDSENNFITFHKNQEDKIGFFSVTVSAPTDSPISFFDVKGNNIGTFHIFGDKAENNKTMGIVNELDKRFSITEQVDCNKTKIIESVVNQVLNISGKIIADMSTGELKQNIFSKSELLLNGEYNDKLGLELTDYVTEYEKRVTNDIDVEKVLESMTIKYGPCWGIPEGECRE